VVGDMMSLDRLPGVAEVAMQAGYYCARRLIRRVGGRPAAKPFRNHDLGAPRRTSHAAAPSSRSDVSTPPVVRNDVRNAM
jgi:NADH:ubiquinone reductase (H+-translocating)